MISRSRGAQVAAAVLAGLVLQAVLPHLTLRTGLIVSCVPVSVAGWYCCRGLIRQARAQQGRMRAGLAMGATSGGLLGLSYAVYTLQAVLGDRAAGLLTVADLASVLAATVAIPGLITVIPPFPDRITRLAHLVDLATVAGAVFAAAWQFAIAPAAAVLPASDRTLVLLTVLPEVAAAALALMLISRTVPGGQGSLRLLAGGLGLLVLGALGGLHIHAEQLPWYADGQGLLYVTGGLIIGLAGRDNTVGAAETSGWRPYTGFWSVIAHLPVAFVLVVAGVQFARTGTLSTALTAAVLACGILALLRHLLHLVVVRRLLADLDAERARLDHQAHHDALTGLPNRAAFHPYAAAAVAAAAPGSAAAILLLDLDGFKQVNDSLGHAAGDELLVGVADRLRAGLRNGDLAARLGGDEFAVVLTGLSGPSEALAVGERLLAGLTTPMTVQGHELRPGGSAGVGVTTDPARDADALLREADAALYSAKAAGKGVVHAGTGKVN